MKEYLKQYWHPLTGGALIGYVCGIVGFGIFDWQYYLIAITSVVWYVTKPHNR